MSVIETKKTIMLSILRNEEMHRSCDSPRLNNELFILIDEKQEIGTINMFDTPRWLRQNFDISKKESFQIFGEWIEYTKTKGDKNE